MAEFDVFGDMSDVDKIEGVAADFRQLALGESRLPGPPSNHRRMVLLAPSDAAYGVARMFEVLAEAVDYWSAVEATRTMDEARRVLGLPADWVPVY